MHEIIDVDAENSDNSDESGDGLDTAERIHKRQDVYDNAM